MVYIREDCAAEVLKVPDPLQAGRFQVGLRSRIFSEVNRRMVDRCNAEVGVMAQCAGNGAGALVGTASAGEVGVAEQDQESDSA